MNDSITNSPAPEGCAQCLVLSPDVAEAVKEEIGYEKFPGCCGKCKHSSIDGDPLLCHIAGLLGAIVVEETAWCRRFSRRIPW